MLLIVGCARDTRYDSKHCAESIIHTINCVRHPAASASMPAFTFQDGVEHRTRTGLGSHCAQDSRMRFFLQRAFPQEFLDVLFARQGAISLIVKLRFVPFFRRSEEHTSELQSRR